MAMSSDPRPSTQGARHNGRLSAAGAGVRRLRYAASGGAGLARGGERELADNVTSDLVLDAMWLSAVTSTIALTLAVVFGTPVAYLLARREFPGKTLVDLVLDLPIVLPPTVAGVALLVAFGRRGVLGGRLDDIGIDLAFTTTAVVMAQLFVSAPYYIRTAKAGFEGVSPQYEGVAATLGAGPMRTFFRIVLPLSWPSVLAGAILCWARALSELGATLVFAGNFPGAHADHAPGDHRRLRLRRLRERGDRARRNSRRGGGAAASFAAARGAVCDPS